MLLLVLFAFFLFDLYLSLSLSLFRLLSIANLKKQVEQQQAEYDRMADELAAAKGETPSTKKD